MPHDFQLIETLLHERGTGYYLLDRHLDRLRASAAHFGFLCDEPHIVSVLGRAVDGCGEERLRVRLLLSADGEAGVTSTPMATLPAAIPMAFVLSTTRMHSADPFLRHKTTKRALYDGEWKHYSETLGAGEVIYINERGEITEGSRTNIFVERGGRLLTPPTSCGLLPGVLRAELLARGEAEEALLTVADLQDADAVFLGNSVRKLVPARRIARP